MRTKNWERCNTLAEEIGAGTSWKYVRTVISLIVYILSTPGNYYATHKILLANILNRMYLLQDMHVHLRAWMRAYWWEQYDTLLYSSDRSYRKTNSINDELFNLFEENDWAFLLVICFSFVPLGTRGFLLRMRGTLELRGLFTIIDSSKVRSIEAVFFIPKSWMRRKE